MHRIITEDFLKKYKDKKPPFGFNGLGYVVYKRTYSRLKDDDTREEWPETIARCINGAQEIGADYTKEEAEIPKEDLINIITKKFPDFRSTLVEVQSYLDTGAISDGTGNVSNKVKLELYNTLYEDLDFEKTYHFLMSNFGAEKIDVMIKLLGKPFIDWCITDKKESVNKLFETAYIIADYSSKLEGSTDPLILGITIIGKFRDILKNPV